MKRFSCLLVILAMFALLAACGTDDPASHHTPHMGPDTTSGGGGDVGTDTTTPLPDTGPADTGVDAPTATDTGTDTSAPQPCATNDDCTAPQVCVVDRSGDTVSMTCQDPSGSGGLGDDCTDDSECASNLCVNGKCSQPCERPVDCSSDGSFICDPTDIQTGTGATQSVNVCVPKPPTQCTSDADCTSPERCLAVKGSDSVTFECGTPNSGGGDVGATCSTDSDCAQNLCQNGVCSAPCAANGDCAAGDGFSCEISQVDLGNGNTDNAQVCTPPTPCTNKDDCRLGEVCRVDRATGDMTCGAPNTGGGSLGDVCTGDQACAANLCNSDRFGDVCSVPCADNSDCPTPGYECGTATVDNGNGGTNDVSVCVAKDPTSCTSNNDCASGLTCAIVPNKAGSALESVCIPSSGGRATGVPCTSDDQCASRVCLNDHCSVPCSASNQCGTNQLCQNNTITKQSLSGAFDVCETLADEECDQTGTCSDGVRMCNDLRTDPNNSQVHTAYCGMPDATASGSLGDHCEAQTDCRSRLCLATNSDECSVVCTSNSQCASGQICSTFSLDSSQLGFCTAGCTDNASCSGLNYTDSNGNTVDHVCTINGNTRNNSVDQICTRRNIVDPNDSSVGALGDSCQSTADCQTGLCLTNTVYNGQPCSTAADCASGQVCDTAPSGGGKQCGDRAFYCTRICNDNTDCSGGVSGNPLTVCDSNIGVQLTNGVTDTISACATAP